MKDDVVSDASAASVCDACLHLLGVLATAALSDEF